LLVAIDSLAGTVPEAEQDDALLMGANKPGGQHAKACAQFYRDIIGPLANEKCVFLMLNQLKDAIGTMTFGAEPPEALIGGTAQRFHSTYQWKMQLTKQLVAKDEFGAERKYGSRHKISCTRNKLGREGTNQFVEFDLYREGGVDWWTSLVRKVATDYTGLITEKGGNYFSWDVPNTPYINEDGKEVEFDISSKYKSYELAKMIKTSTPAKELIRKYFTIPALPSPEEVQAAEAEHKQKRKRKQKEDAVKEL